MLAAVLLVILGLKQVAQEGLAPLPLLAIPAGVVIGLAFVRRQRTLAYPLIDLRLFRSPTFTIALASYLLATFVAFGSYVFMAQYLQLVLGLSPLAAGLWTLPGMAAFIVGSNLSPVLVRRFRPVSVMLGGLLLAAVGFGMITQIDTSSGLAVLVTGTVVYSLGLSPIFTLTTDIILSSAPPERAGSAAAISETGSELGGALGIAILGSIGTAVYRSQVGDAAPAGLSNAAMEAARSTLGGAVAVSEGLPESLAAALLGPAREAFTDALRLSAAVGAVVVVAIAAAIAVLQRREP